MWMGRDYVHMVSRLRTLTTNGNQKEDKSWSFYLKQIDCTGFIFGFCSRGSKRIVANLEGANANPGGQSLIHFVHVRYRGSQLPGGGVPPAPEINPHCILHHIWIKAGVHCVGLGCVDG